jgi:tRNA-modifying protein YgfZ
MTLQETLTQQGAALAPDGIPLHFGDLNVEYHAAVERAVLMNRSHEGRLEMVGRDRLALPHRISTNDLTSLAVNAGAPTIFVNPTARILDRATFYNRGDSALAITEPGRGPALMSYLQRNVFFNDDFRLVDLTPLTRQFDLHGPAADAIVETLVPGASTQPPFYGTDVTIAGTSVFLARNKPVSGKHWTMIVQAEPSADIWNALLEAGQPHGLIPAGSLTYNTLRIRAGRPSVGRELSTDYIPLEVGLWDEVSFQKGCYTGQEIIARMESRNRLAKVMVSLSLASWVEAPADVFHNGHAVGTLTSSVAAPDGDIYGIAVIKTAAAQPGESITVGANAVNATIGNLAGAPPPMLAA